MSKELCNDGRCTRVRMGEDRHPLHRENKDEAQYNQKQLAFLQIAITVIVTLGSVLIAVGLSQQTNSTVMELTSNLVNDTSISEIFKKQSANMMDMANFSILLGLGFIVVGLSLGVSYLRKNINI